MDTGLAIRIRANQKAEYFSWGQTGFRLGHKCAGFPTARSRLHIAVIGNFIFIGIRTAASWRARSIQAVFA